MALARFGDLASRGALRDIGLRGVTVFGVATVRGESAWGRWAHRGLFAAIGLLPPGVRARCLGALFDVPHRWSADPWSVLSSRYEQVKRDALVSAVAGRCVSSVLEVGCSVGGNLGALADVFPSASVWGVDVSGRAVVSARARLREYERVRVERVGSLAEVSGLVSVPFDLVVCSEVLYYLGPPRALTQSLAPLRDVLAPHASAVFVHSAADALALHRVAAAALGLGSVVDVPYAVRGCPARFVVSVASRSESVSLGGLAGPRPLG